SQVTTYAANESGASLDSTAFTYTTGAGTTCGGCQVSGSYAMSLDISWTMLSVNLASHACFNPPPNQKCPSLTGRTASNLPQFPPLLNAPWLGIRQLIRDRRGAAAVMLAIVLTGIVGFAGLGSEVAAWYFTTRAMQNATSSAAASAAATLAAAEV